MGYEGKEIFAIAVVVVLAAGTVFWVYWAGVCALTPLARGILANRPGTLFITACSLQTGLGLLALLLNRIELMGLFLLAVLGPWGVVGLLIGGLGRMRRGVRMEAARYHAARPPAKLQCWMQEIYVAVFFYAVALTGVTLICNAAQEDLVNSVVPAAAYLLAGTSLGLYAALDVLRRLDPPLGLWSRCGVILGVIVFFNASLILCGLMAWRSWRRALETAGLNAWRRSLVAERRAQKQEAAPAAAHAPGTHDAPPP